MNRSPEPPPAKGGPAGRALNLAGHVLTGGYLIVAALTLAWGAYRRFHIPQTPTVDPDIRGYLGPALGALTGRGFMHLDGRSFPYPAFVFLILRLFGDFRAIAVAQHTLGVAAGGLVLLAWNALARLAPPGGIPRPLARWLGLGPAAIYLGSATSVLFEQEIRPEAVFPFLAILNLLVSFLFLERRFITRSASAQWLGALNLFIALLIYLMKPAFGLATLFSTAPVWLSLFLPGTSARGKGALLAAAILPAAILLFLPEQLLKRDDAVGRLFLPETLFSVHAPLILDQMSRDLADGAATPYPRAVIQAAHDLLAGDLRKAALVTTKVFPSLGFNPDYLMYDSFCIEFPSLPVNRRWTIPGLADFYTYYYRRAAMAQPSALLRKVLDQMRVFYCWKLPVYHLGKSLSITSRYADAAEVIASHIPYAGQYAPLGPYLRQCATLRSQGADVDQFRRLTEWTRLLSAHYLDLLFVALVSPLLLIFCPFRAHLPWLVAALWLTYSYNFGNCLTIAIVHSLDVVRYVRIQLIYTVFAQCASVYFVLETITYGARLIVKRRVRGA